MFSLSRPSTEELAAVVAGLADQQFSYDEVGATRTQVPTGYGHHEDSIALGEGRGVFDRAVEGIRQWQPHRGAGVVVEPAQPPIETGADVLLLVRTLGLFVLASCRVAYVIDEPRTFGFAYGTLPMHPEKGEELFLVSQDDNDVVRFQVSAFSRPGHPLIRLGRPVAELIQRQTTRRYLAGLRDFVCDR